MELNRPIPSHLRNPRSAHGTGTQLGDAIELQAISDVFNEGRGFQLFVGSAKAVLGHTEECAGLVGEFLLPLRPSRRNTNHDLRCPESHALLVAKNRDASASNRDAYPDPKHIRTKYSHPIPDYTACIVVESYASQRIFVWSIRHFG